MLYYIRYRTRLEIWKQLRNDLRKKFRDLFKKRNGAVVLRVNAKVLRPRVLLLAKLLSRKLTILVPLTLTVTPLLSYALLFMMR